MLCIFAAIVFTILAPRARGQWTFTYVVDNAQALAALETQERVDKMVEALERAKAKLELIASASTGSMIVTIDWTAPSDPGFAAESNALGYFQTVATARDKLINKATEDNEPQSEIAIYQALPTASVPFFYDSATQLSAVSVIILSSLNKHLAFLPVTDPSDGVIRFRPPLPGGTKWQFYKTKKNLEGYEVFEAVVVHEAIHLMGFISEANSDTVPTRLTSWDLFRFGDASISSGGLGGNAFGTLARELRPTVEASGITAFNNAARVYKLSRGRRTGGDGSQASHWRAFSRLDPPVAIGVMDPSASGAVHASLGERMFTRPEVEALDVMGWNVNPDSITYANAGTINLSAPIATAQIAQGSAITFEWSTDTNFVDLDVCIYPGTEIVDDNPVRVFYQLPAGTTSATLSSTNALPPGEYVWGVIGSTQTGYRSSEDRRFTIVAVTTCDSIDFNNDTSLFDPVDIEAFLSVYSEGPCVPSTAICNDVDFNNDGVTFDPCDIASFMLVFGEGPCTQCGQ